MYQQRTNMYEGLFNVQIKTGYWRDCRWEDNVEMDFQEVDLGAMDWIAMAQDRESWRALP